MAKNPAVDNEKFFDFLANAAQWEEHRKETDFPWSGYSEDREKVHDAIAGIYSCRQLPRPIFSWARSPYSMFGAMQYLRSMQIGSRQEAIKAIVRGGDPLEAEARAVFLESVMEKNLTVTVGANMRDIFGPRSEGWLKPVKQLAEILERKFTPPPNGKPLSAGWKDWVMYSIAREFNHAMLTQTLCIAPFMRIVWISRPPMFLKTDDEGNLHCGDGPAVRFEDGFEIWHQHVKPERLETPEVEVLEGKTVLALPAPKEEG